MACVMKITMEQALDERWMNGNVDDGRATSGKKRDLLGLAHAADRREGIVGRHAWLPEHAARDDGRAERGFHRGFRRRLGQRIRSGLRWQPGGTRFSRRGNRRKTLRDGFWLRRSLLCERR